MTARITIDGNLVADPDFGVGDNGTSWAHLRVASHERIKRDGEWISTDPEFYNVTLFGEPAEQAANELHKGDRVTLAGRPQLETFDRRDGTTGSAIKVYTRKVTRTDSAGPADTPGMSRDVDAGEMTIRIDDPDDPLGPPAYEGLVSAAHTQLAPGIYPAASYGDGVTAFDATGSMQIEVTATGSRVQQPTGEASVPVDAATATRIHHTAEATSVVNVGKTATAMHKTLKDNGFRWSSASTSWNLPTDLDEHTRSARVSELLSSVRANGRDLPVVHHAAPQLPGKSAPAPSTVGAPPAATVTASQHTGGRSL